MTKKKKLITVDTVPGKADYTDLKDALQKAIKTTDHNSIEIILSPGTYHLDQTLVLGDEGFSHPDRELTISGSEGESFICGCRRLTTENWSKNEAGVFSAKVRNLDSKLPSKLIIEGRQYHLARYPDFNESELPFQGNRTEKEILQRARLKKWSPNNNSYLHALHGAAWGDYHFKIKKRSFNKFSLSGGHQNNRREILRSRKQVFVEGIFEELTAPGEFFYNEKQKTLYLIPYEGTQLNKHTNIEASLLHSILQIKGSKSTQQNISLRGLSFYGTAPTFMEKMEPLLRSDWMIHRGGALFIENARNIQITNCRFEYLDGNALFVSGNCEDVRIQSSLFRNIGASAIVFAGESKDVRHPLFNYHERHHGIVDATAGPLGNNHPRNCLVYDNLIYRSGRIEKQSAGVQISMSRAITVRHNTIYELPRAGINIGDGTWGGHDLDGNSVFDTVKETSDHGAFNSWGRDRFWDKNRNITDRWVKKNPQYPLADAVDPVRIRNNCFHCDHGWDIDLDDGSSHYIIEKNLCLSGGIKLREGFHRIVENNIMLNNGLHPHVWYATDDSDVIKHNIMMTAYGRIGLAGQGKEVDYNFFHHTHVDRSGFDSWDRNSLSGNVGFTDPAKGDFTLKADSPALELGFKNIPTAPFGLKSERLKKMAREPQIPRLNLKTSDDAGDSCQWRGVRFKEMMTPGEQSAAGLNEITGVIVTEGPADSMHSLSLQQGDVILKIGSHPVRSTEDFLRLVNRARFFSHKKTSIWRNQTLIKISMKLR